MAIPHPQSGTLGIVAVVAALLYFLFLFVEGATLRWARRSIKMVIHVNGTRGKTETTRLIAGALRMGGFRVVAKTTGTEPRIIFPDARERRVRRMGAANVREQRDLLLLAARLKAEIVVAECMAVSSDAQAASTAFLVPDVLVVTNVRSDHELELGDADSTLDVFVSGIPHGGTVVTSEKNIFPTLDAAARRCGAQATLAEPHAASDYLHPDNVGVAIAVASMIGVDAETALRGIASHSPDIGAFALRLLEGKNGSRITIADALAANDPESTEILFQMARGPYGEGSRRLLLLNGRSDRPDRSHLFARWASSSSGRWDGVILVGAWPRNAMRLLRTAYPGTDARGKKRVRRARRIEDLRAEDDGSFIFAAGNWKKLGPAIASRSKRCTP